VGSTRRALLLSPLVGAIAGLAALALELGLEHATPLLVGRFADLGGPAIFDFRWGILLLPMAGGLLSGVVVHLVAHQQPGQGTDQMVRAFHRDDGVLPLPGPATKAAACVGVIAAGGSAGPEGPTAGLGAAIGAAFGQAFRLTPRDRRVLLVAGCAAGIGAIFYAPLGGALFGASVLYRRPEFEGRALVPAFIASAVGYATFQAFTGFGERLLTHADALRFASAWELPIWLALGLACGGAALVFSTLLRGVERGFARLSALPLWLRPGLGGLATGLLACALPQVMDGRYAMIRNALDGSLFAGSHRDLAAWALLLLALVLAKSLATALTVGSGAAGGVLGPSLWIGGATGAFLGALLEAAAPNLLSESLRQALVPVGMAGVLAAAMRTPLAAVVMVMEMTGSYGLIVPLMVVTTAAYVVGSRSGLIDAQVTSSADSPAHAADAIVSVLERVQVGDILQGVWPAVAQRATPLSQLVASLPAGEPPTVAVLEDGRLVGVISFAELQHSIDADALGPVLIAEDLMTRHFPTLEPGQTLYEALSAFEHSQADAIPVVAGAADASFLGMLTRAAAREAVVTHLEELRDYALREHSGLATLDEQSRLAELLTGLPREDSGRVLRMPVPAELVGRSLRELDFRRRQGSIVLAIRTADRELLAPPDPARALAAGDQLVLLAEPSQARRQSASLKPAGSG